MRADRNFFRFTSMSPGVAEAVAMRADCNYEFWMHAVGRCGGARFPTTVLGRRVLDPRAASTPLVR
jgi:hypothetical protein